jgi:hypothetical protein
MVTHILNSQSHNALLPSVTVAIIIVLSPAVVIKEHREHTKRKAVTLPENSALCLEPSKHLSQGNVHWKVAVLAVWKGLLPPSVHER